MDYGEPSLKSLQDSIDRIGKELAKHEVKDAKNMEYVEKRIHEEAHKSERDEGTDMGMDNISDRVNINLPGGGDGGFGGAGMAAVIAALGNRNQGNDNAALIAALGNRNDDSANWAPLMAMAGGGGFGANNGMNNMWPIILLALLGRGRGGGLFGGGDGDCGGGGDAVNQLTLNQVLAKLGTLEGAVPLAACDVQNSILEQTNALQSTLNENNIAQLQATTNVKDTVQNATAVLLNQGNQNTQAILQAVAAVGTKIDTNTIADLQRQLAVAQSRETEERHHSRIREVEVNVSQQVNQQQRQDQFQAQVQAQFGSLFGILNGIAVNNNRSNQDILNLGTMLASGVQTPTTTQVNK